MIVRRSLSLFILALALFGANSAHAVSTTVVISQFQVAGGTAADEFVELHNVSNASVDLNGYRVVYRSAAGVTDVAIVNWTTSTVIPAGGYYLIGATPGYDGATLSDVTYGDGGSGRFSGTSGGLALRNGALNTGTIIDSVGYGAATNAFVETATETVPAANASAARQTNGCQDTDNNATDFVAVNPSAPRNSATAVAVCGGSPALTLSINDVSQAEGNAATTTFTFTVSLTAPAGPGGVTFNIATADGTAQDDNPATEDNDYIAQSLTGQTIPAGSSTYSFNVTVNGDTTTEANETFFVNVTSVTGATAGDTQGQGTIQNDDVTIVLIHDVQGSGTSSPVAGSTVTIRGIVTLLKSTGFFLQEEIGDYDADPNTSEGIFVFTSSVPTVAVGDTATVTGTVVEFNGLTEISPVSNVTIFSTGNPLPAPVTLTTTELPPNATLAQPQLEKYESMRVTAASLTTVAPNDDFYDVDTVITGQPRPFREPGIPASDPIPPDPTTGLPDCCIPIWDENGERLVVDTNGRASSTGETLTSNVTLTNVTGPLDFAFSRFRLINEANLTRSANMSAVPVPLPAANEFTIAGYNIENFNNNATQRQKAALTIRDVLRLPDIIGAVEIFDLADLQALAAEIQTISGVTYSAHLIEQDGASEDNDQDLGFLVKTSRVSVTSVTAERTTDTFINPNTNAPETLHDRPPLVLRGVVNPSSAAPQPVIVVVNHLRSFIDVDLVAGDGPRVRAKRKAQAESLAGLLQELQTNNPTTAVVSVGDYNAFQFNSGYDDSISVLTGAPTPDDQIVVDQSPDLVNPNFFNLLLNVPADQRYSFIFEGTPQSLDHVLVNTVAQAIYTRIAAARVNADFPSVLATVFASNAARPEANSDHDPLVAYFALPATANLNITKTDSPDPVNAGQNLAYTITVSNFGPDAASTASFSDPLPAGTTFVSLSQPGGWTCTTPAVGANGTVTCSIASLGVGSAAFILTVNVNANVAATTTLSNTATVTSTTVDPTTGNESATETTTVATSADLLLSKTDSPDPVTAGSNLSYTITLTNSGPSNAASASFSDTLPAGTTFVSLSTTGPWSCTTPAVGATGTVTCTNTSFLVTVDFFTLVVKVDANVAAGTVLSNTATLSSATTDPNGANNSATATTTVAGSADLSVTKTDAPDPVNAGSSLTYTITVNNAGPSNAAAVSLSDTLPAGTTFVSLSPAAGWSCNSLTVGSGGTLTCTNTSMAVGNAVFTLVVNVDPNVAAGTVLSNSATVSSTTSDPNTGNQTGTATTTVATLADLLLSKTDSPDPVNAGANLSYQITMTNAGPSNAASATFSDTLPAGTTFVSLSTTGPWSCTTPAVGATGTVTCTNPSFGVTVDFFTLVVNVNANVAAGTVLSNTATLSSTTPDPNGENNSATATTTVGTAANLSVTKVDTPDPVTAGTNLTYTITVNNAGPSNASTLSLSDTVPANTTFVSLASPAGWSCGTPAVGGTGGITCTVASMAVGNAVFTLVVNVNAGTTNGTVITNSATISSSTLDPTAGNETGTATTTVGSGSADISVAKVDTPDPVTGGSNLTYTITVTNAGPSNATSATLSDPLPTGTTFVSLSSPAGWICTPPAVGANGTVNCTAASLAIGNSVFTLTVNVDPALVAGTVLTNTATAGSATSDPNSANQAGTATTAVATLADLSVTKTDSPDPVTAGTNLTYTIAVNNAGPTFAAGVTLTESTPANTTFVSMTAPAGWSCTTPAVGGTGAISCTNSSVGLGIANFTLVVNVNSATPAATTLTNTATVSSTTPDPNTGNQSDTETTTTTAAVTSADLSIAKVDTPDPVNAGTNLTYTITITNAGPNASLNANFSDVLPANTSFVSVAGPGWNCALIAGGPSGTVICANPSVGVGSSAITLVVAVDAAAAAGTTITNTAGVSSETTPDPNTGNQSATATTTVRSQATLSATKTVSGSFLPGGQVIYTIVITNAGPSTQANNPGNEFVDILPAQLDLVSASANSGTAVATIATNTVTWNGSIPAGGSVTITIVATIDPATAGGTTVSNQGTVNYDADGNGTNESTRQTDSPAAAGPADPTTFSLPAAVAADLTTIPTLDEYALMALSALLAAIAMMVMKRA